MTTWLKQLNAYSSAFLMAPADEGTGGGNGVGNEGAGDKPDAGSVLFPGDKPNGDAKQGDAKAADGAVDWKEYVPDPAKSEAENAAAKTEHDKGKPAEKSDVADSVPENGKYDLKMPDGVDLDTELADALGPEFADLKLTNAQAQKLVDKYIAVQTARMEKQGADFAETVAGWADTAKKDPDMGGDRWDGTVKTAQRAVNALGTPALKDYLNASGGGNHPELIRFMAKAGELIKEDNPAGGGAEGTGKPAEAAYTLFPTDAPKG